MNTKQNQLVEKNGKITIVYIYVYINTHINIEQSILLVSSCLFIISPLMSAFNVCIVWEFIN